MQQWEYLIEQFTRGNLSGGDWEKVKAKLNDLGQQGWELIAVDSSNGRYFFKRPKSAS